MDNTVIFTDLNDQDSLYNTKAIKRTCLVLFYSSLFLLAVTVFLSEKNIQIITSCCAAALGICLLLSQKNYLLTSIYLVNIVVLGAITLVPYFTHAYDVSFLTFIPVLIGNKFLLRVDKHFWRLLFLNVVFASCYILLANQKEYNHDFIVEGVVYFLNLFVMVRILFFVDEDEKNDKEKLNKRLEFLQGIVDINPQLIYAKSKEGKFIFANKLFAESLGLTKEEIIGKTDFDISNSKEKALADMSRDIAVMDSGKFDKFNEELTDDDGEVQYFHSIRAPLKDSDDNVTGVLGMSMDRSSEKRNEKKLFDSKLLYQALFDNLNDGVIVYDYTTEKISSFNEAASKILRFEKSTDVKKYNRFHFFPETIGNVNVHEELAGHKERILNSQIIKGNAIMKRVNGELFECKISVYPNPGQHGQGIIVIKDISVEVKAKREILRSKNYFRQVYDNSPVAISMTDIETMKVFDINATHKRVFGYTLEKLQSLSINDLVPKIDLDLQNTMIAQLRDGRRRKHVQEREFINISGETLRVRTSQSIIKRDGKEILMEFMEDITELYRQEARYKFLFESAFDGIVVNDYDKGLMIDYNNKFREFLELDESFDKAEYKTLDYSPEFQDNGMSSLENFKQNVVKVKEQGSLDFNWKFKLKNGAVKYADISLIHQEDAQENLTYAIYRETTSERLTQRALKESEKRFRLIFDNAFDGLYFFNYKTQKIIQANSRLYELFESTPDRLLIDKPHLTPEIQPDGTRTLDNLKIAFKETLEKGKSRATRIFVKNDGTIVHLEISAFLLSPPDDDIIVSIYKDITDQKKAEDVQVLNATQEEKLDALGRELSSYTLFTTQKNRLLQELSEDLKVMTTLENGEGKLMAERVRRKIANNLDEKENWLNFKLQFERVHPGFFSKLEKNFTDLSSNDLKHCAYIKMGLSNSEISDVLFVGKKAVEMSHYRLKKKMGFAKEVTLKKALQKY